jgi:hypothetical protein
MSDDNWYTGVAVATMLVLVVGLLTGLALGGAFSGGSSPASPPASTAPDYLYFTVTTSAATQYDTYYPANVSVPHGEPIVITINCYDNGTNPVVSPFEDVIGTQGGAANFTLGPNATTRSLSSLPIGNISHTFSVTLPGMAGQLLIGAGNPYINVPVPPSPDGIHPTTVTFTVTFPSTGVYAWRCAAPCDPYSMVTPGFMIGSIDVT